ncbi:TRAP transporter substrate-binding protein [Hominifimenecus sp. rT4P-3]|uniref:TRAP transporter substrate-binding protein n=1 Tax=Hominifimenecus sp. rT4P-3 TaxID=3242979 RepID=UPI003DA3BC8B
MKKLIGLALACSLVLTACGSGSTSTTAAPTTAPSETTAGAATEAASNEAETTAAAPSGEAEYNFTIGTSATKDSAIGKTMQYAADLIAERTNGRISITCYPDSQLGSDAELVEGVQLGNVTMVIGNTAPQVAFVPSLALFDLPNTYDDISVAQTVLAGFTEKMAGSFEGTQMHLCQLFPTVFRYMSSNKEIKTVDDFNGIKIRTMTNNNHMAYWNALGATATPLDFSELYIGLQQGLVDAQENPLDIFLSSNFYEQQKYVINTKHIAFVATILMNQETWDSLPADLQQTLTECFTEIGQYGTKVAQEAESQNIQTVKDKDVAVIELDDATLAAMKEKAQPVYDMVREAVGSELVDEYLAAIEASSK